MNKEMLLHYLNDMVELSYRNSDIDGAKAYLDVYEKINNGEFDKLRLVK